MKTILTILFLFLSSICQANIVTFVEKFMFDISMEIDRRVPLEDFTDAALLSTIEKVCNEHQLTVKQSYYIIKIFWL